MRILIFLLTLVFVLDSEDTCAQSRYKDKTIGKVGFENPGDSLEEKKLEAFAGFCNFFIQNYYPSFNSRVFIALEPTEKASSTVLGYDNIHGWSVRNDLTKPSAPDLTELGIRIKITGKNPSPQTLLKLLDYALSHEEEVKQTRVDAMKLDYSDRPHEISFTQKKIKRILKRKPSANVKNTVARL